MNKTSIEWCNRPGTLPRTWNPIRARLKVSTPGECDCPCELCGDQGLHCGKPPCSAKVGTFCTRISPGCTNCYASTINKRFGNGLEYTVPNLENIEFFLSEKILQEPLKTKKPCTIFVGDMFDLFHESIPQEFIDEIFSVMQRSGAHTFQLLTKRAGRIRAYCADETVASRIEKIHPAYGTEREGWCSWPLDNVWLGVSVESQKYADERIPLLLQTPAAVRFLSVEPQLEAVDLDSDGIKGAHALGCGDSNHKDGDGFCRGVDWVIVGGESGPHARPFNLAWAESLRDQCKAAGVAFFMKQVGSNPEFPSNYWPARGADRLKDRKGGDPAEWPESLRVREFPG
jgi:protein gp37